MHILMSYSGWAALMKYLVTLGKDRALKFNRRELWIYARV